MYIGSSINMAKRLVDHIVDNDTNVHLQNAINCQGIENFVFVVVEVFKVDPELSLKSNKANLLALEQKHLDWLFSLPESLRYNFNPTAGSSLGYKHTDDTRAKMSDAHTGKSITPDTRVKISASMTGKTHSEESRAQLTPEG